MHILNNLVVAAIIAGVAIAVIAGAVLALTGQAPEPDIAIEPASEQEASGGITGVVQVGVLLPATGDLASHGQDNSMAARLAGEDFNAYLDEKNAGWNIELILEDTQTSPVSALEKVQGLNAKGVKLILGPESSSEVKSVSSYADSNGMIIISPSSTSPALAIQDNVFRLTPDDTKQGKVVARLLADNGKQVAIPIYRGDVWGEGLYESSKASFEELGGTVDEGIKYSPEITTFSAEAAVLADKINSYRDQGYTDDQIGILMISFSEAVHLLNSASEYEDLAAVQWFGSDASSNDDAITEDRIAREFISKVNFVSSQFAPASNDIYQRVKDILTERIGTSPNNYAYSSYDSVWLLGLAMEQTQSTDADTLTNVLHDVGANHVGAIGTINLNEEGDLAIADYDLFTVQDGGWVIYGKYIADTDSIQIGGGALEGVVHVGVLLPATGDLASHGQDNSMAARLAGEDFNAYLDEKNAGWNIELILEDTQTSPVSALEKVQGLNAKGVKLILGPESSSEVKSVSSYADSNGMIIISPSSTSPALAIQDNVFRLTPDDTKQGKVVARLLADNGKQVAIPIYRGDVWGEGLYESSKTSFEALEGTVDEGIKYSPEITTFSAEALVLANKVNEYRDQGYTDDQIGILMISFSEAVHLLNSASEYEDLAAVQWFGSDASSNDDAITEDRIAREFISQVNFVSSQFAPASNDIYQRVKDILTERIGTSPNNYAYSSYDSVWLLGLAMEQTQSTDADTLTNVLHDVGANHVGAIGTINLNEEGDLAIADYDLFTVQDGGWVIYGKYIADTDSIQIGSAATETVQIGVLLPGTGDLSTQGQDETAAARLAGEDFNSYLDEKNAGWNIELILEDTQTSPVVALEKTQGLNAKGIKLIVGPGSSAEVQSMLGYTGSNSMLVVSPASTSPDLAIEDDNVFRLTPDDTKQGKVIARLLADGGKEVAIPIYRGDVWGEGLYESSKASFEELGGMVDEGIKYSPEITTFSAEALVLANKVNEYRDQGYTDDQIGILMISFSEAVHLLNSASQYDDLAAVQWLGSDASSGDDTITQDEIASGFISKVNFVSSQFAPADNEIYQRVKAILTERIGTSPNNYAYSYYDAVWLLGLAVEQIDTADAGAIIDVLPDVGAGHVGTVGAINFNAAGDLAISDFDLSTVRDGAWVSYGRYIADTDMIEIAPDPITGIVQVGVLLPATGDLASHGQDNSMAARLAGEDFNAYLDEKNAGWNIELILEDTQTSPVSALEKVQGLNAKGVKLILGPESSSEVKSVSSYADSNGMIIISPSSTSPALAIQDNVFRLTPDDTKQGKVVARLLADNGKQVAIPIYRGDVWGEGLYESSKTSFEALEGTVDEGIKYSPEITTFSAEALVLANKVNEYRDQGYTDDQIGILMISFSEAVHLLNSASEYEDLAAVQWFGSDASSNDDAITEDRIAREFISQVNFVSSQFAPASNDIYQRVKDILTERIGTSPNNYAYSSYDSVWLLGLAMEQTQSTDADTLTGVLHDVGANHVGAIGTINLNEEGDLAIADYDLFTVQDGGWVIYGKYIADTDMIEIAPDPITGIVQVGVLLPATGDLASHGQDNSMAARLAGEDFNAYLDEKNAGWNIELILEDTQTSPVSALEKVQGLNAKGVKLILGPESSSEVKSVSSYADSNGMIIISPSSTSPALAIKDNVFRLTPDDTKQGKVVARLLADNGKQVAIPIYRGDVWGEGLYESSKTSFEALEGTVDEGIKYSPEITTFSAEALVLANKVNEYRDQGYTDDQIGILMISFSEAVHLLNSASEYEDLAAVQWFGSDASSNDDAITEDRIAREFISQVNFVSSQFAPASNDIYQRVKDILTERIGTSPNNYAYSSYDSVWLLGLAMKQTQSTDADTLTNVLHDVGANHVGAIGTINLNEEGDLAIADYDLFTVQDGGWVIYGKYIADTDSIEILP